MSEVRSRRVDGLPHEAGACCFCHHLVVKGAYWFGAVDLFVCAGCIFAGRLGLLIGDAFDSPDAIHRALLASEREAWRARQERRARAEIA